MRAAVAKWNGATELVNDSAGLSNDLSVEVKKMERLFEEGQADLTKLMQARQRLIQLENSRLDAVWQATQAQADLLLALGIPSMINDMINSIVNVMPCPARLTRRRPGVVDRGLRAVPGRRNSRACSRMQPAAKN